MFFLYEVFLKEILFIMYLLKWKKRIIVSDNTNIYQKMKVNW